MELDITERSLKMSTRDYVYETMRRNILNLKLLPGQMISESGLTQLLKVSRTPLREAFVKLSDEELIEIHPQKGSFVSAIDLEQIVEARFVRENMEVAIVKLACEMLSDEDLEDLRLIVRQQQLNHSRKHYDKLLEADEEFHRTLFAKCDKSRTWNAVQYMQVHYIRLRQLMLSINFGWDKIVSEHTQILEAIERKDKELAEQVMRTHLRLFVYVSKEKLLELYPGYIKM
ncbi:MAG: GntR family transcriptional regulator [Paenibacillus sp.]|nr:GntR family transcriptional regulator [Paenibacillus sp.]